MHATIHKSQPSIPDDFLTLSTRAEEDLSAPQADSICLTAIALVRYRYGERDRRRYLKVLAAWRAS